MKAATPGCTYKEFLACKPAEFAGNEGATAVLRWLEKTEAVIAISKCAEEDQVMYASNLFKEGALEWWNTVLQAKGRKVAYAMNWEEFKSLVERKFCPEYEKEQMANKFLSHRMIGVDCRGYTSTFFEYARVVPTLASPEPVLISRYIWGLISEIRNIVKAARPRTIDDAMELANTLTDELVRTREEDRKKELAQKITQGFRMGNTKKRGIGQSSSPPFCRNCRKKHFGRCNVTCNFCKMIGHREEDCRKKTRVCYNCGEAGHFKPDCPKLIKPADNKGKPTEGTTKKNARAFQLTTQEAELIPDVKLVRS
ncbi:putative transcription factor interactor and regulator CCHC(Zn) family [Helianthus annuus]|nr:putative transcription factor interactor and regulator CCHC(Zn) family [Helianthus annuus]